jgi:hypothetical protein
MVLVGCSFNWTGCDTTNVVIGVRILYGLPSLYLCPNCHAVETLYTGLAEQPDALALEASALVA